MSLLPALYPYWFGEFAEDPLFPPTPVADLTFQGSYATRGLERLIKEFQEKPRLAAVLVTWLEAARELEVVFWDILSMSDLSLAFGAHLDTIGKIVGVLRGGLSDTPYRALLRAQIRSLRSRGRPTDIIEVARLVFLSDAFLYHDKLDDEPAAAAIDATGIVLPFDAALTRAIFARTRAAGVRLYVMTTGTPPEETFAFADGGTEETADNGFADVSNPSAPAGAFASAVIA